MREPKLKWLLLLVTVLGLSPFSAGPVEAQAGKTLDIAVVAHPNTPIDNDSLSLAEVRAVFRGDRQYWRGNAPVVLIMRAPVSREREVVLRVIFQMNEAQFKQYWISKIFRAETTSGPKIVYSNLVATQLVSAVPGAIAFIDAKDVGPGVKVIKVNGLKPGESGYPLR